MLLFLNRHVDSAQAVACFADLGIPNPCTPGHPGYYAYADSTSRVVSYNYFIYCSAEGILYLVECPYNSWYNNAFRQCVPGIPPTVTTISPIISHVVSDL